MRIVKQETEFVVCTPSPLDLIERMARLCYQSKVGQSPQRTFLKNIIKRGHESVLEHAYASFIFTVDRGVTHELVRHRLASYSQESTRYVKYSGIDVVCPEDLLAELEAADCGDTVDIQEAQYLPEALRAWAIGCLTSQIAYQTAIDYGRDPEMARANLPTCLKAEIGMTCNFREWRHFIKLRGDKRAHPQIRRVAKDILDWFYTAGYDVIVEDLVCV